MSEAVSVNGSYFLRIINGRFGLLVLNFLLLSTSFLFPPMASADVWGEIDKAWNDVKGYFEVGPAVDKAVKQCAEVTDKAGAQLSKEADKVAKDLDMGSWASSSSVNQYEQRAAEEIKNVQEYKQKVLDTAKRRSAQKQYSLDEGGF